MGAAWPPGARRWRGVAFGRLPAAAGTSRKMIPQHTSVCESTCGSAARVDGSTRSIGCCVDWRASASVAGQTVRTCQWEYAPVDSRQSGRTAALVGRRTTRRRRRARPVQYCPTGPAQRDAQAGAAGPSPAGATSASGPSRNATPRQGQPDLLRTPWRPARAPVTSKGGCDGALVGCAALDERALAGAEAVNSLIDVLRSTLGGR